MNDVGDWWIQGKRKDKEKERNKGGREGSCQVRNEDGRKNKEN